MAFFGDSSTLFIEMVFHYQQFILIPLLYREVPSTFGQPELMTKLITLPIFMLPYSFLFPFTILLVYFDLNSETYWDLIRYYTFFTTTLSLIMTILNYTPITNPQKRLKQVKTSLNPLQKPKTNHNTPSLITQFCKKHTHLHLHTIFFLTTFEIFEFLNGNTGYLGIISISV